MIFCYVISGGVLVGPFSEFEPLSYLHLSFRRNCSRVWHLLFYRNWNIAGTSVWPILMKFGSHSTCVQRDVYSCIFLPKSIFVERRYLVFTYLLEKKNRNLWEKNKFSLVLDKQTIMELQLYNLWNQYFRKNRWRAISFVLGSKKYHCFNRTTGAEAICPVLASYLLILLHIDSVDRNVYNKISR